MNEPTVATRRQMLTTMAMTCGALTCRAFAQTPPPMKPVPANPAHHALTALHIEADLKASPQRIYQALLDAKQFAAFSGLPAEIDPKEGGYFSLFQKQIVGRNLELVPNQRIVQAWRAAADWAPGIYSIVKFDLKPKGAETTIALDHTGFPPGEFDSLTSGWHEHYFGPLKKFLA